MKDPFDDGRPRVLDQQQTQAFQRWLTEVAPLVGLVGWSLHASPYRADPESYATTIVRAQADIAWYAVTTEWLGFSPYDQRATMGHELMHAHLWRISHLMATLIDGELGKRTEAVITAAVGESEELTCDRLGRAVARYLPLIEWTAA